jgi:hypothetical protein
MLWNQVDLGTFGRDVAPQPVSGVGQTSQKILGPRARRRVYKSLDPAGKMEMSAGESSATDRIVLLGAPL